MSKKKMIVLVMILVLGMGVGGGVWWWTKPYDLPAINSDITMEQYGLVFDRELNSTKVIESNTAGDKLSQLKQLIVEEPDNLAYMNELRLYMGSQEREKDFIAFLDSLNSSNRNLKLQTALAYVDLLQDPDLGTASLGKISTQSISVLNEIIEEDPYDVLAHYARGLNNLYWPLGLRRTEKAIQDLAYCVAVAKQLEGYPSPMWPLFYEAYGDALVKNGENQKGMAVWKDGMKKYPHSEALQRRAKAKSDEEAFDIVRQIRGIDVFERPERSISDISILWNNHAAGESQDDEK
ncbi:hypothetical protein [Paenibacillus sp. SYP-B4298]|uniref:hypothetical protein n=1 Tax=Paenibacillus sp. SYP-B4298 TaxID=2996034 RepID=UPI0022DE04B6|nr:hypothetical protein [Paenibacillus sp. SYP-B4298]